MCTHKRNMPQEMYTFQICKYNFEMQCVYEKPRLANTKTD